jgi:hypothetical protein
MRALDGDELDRKTCLITWQYTGNEMQFERRLVDSYGTCMRRSVEESIIKCGIPVKNVMKVVR